MPKATHTGTKEHRPKERNPGASAFIKSRGSSKQISLADLSKQTGILRGHFVTAEYPHSVQCVKVHGVRQASCLSRCLIDKLSPISCSTRQIFEWTRLRNRCVCGRQGVCVVGGGALETLKGNCSAFGMRKSSLC